MSFFERDIRVECLTHWLDWSAGNKNDVFVALPMIQRGSVWKPNQIIDLWDSLLQGMPIGSLMASELAPGMSVRRIGQSKMEKVPAGGGLGLIDGQQRTLAILSAWTVPAGIQMDRRVWVDFADKPPSGQLLRLRVTTVNHPFGFRCDEPSKKLSLDDRRKAKQQFESAYKIRVESPPKPDLINTTPFGARLPIDLSWLIKIWRDNINSPSAWHEAVLKKLDEINTEDKVLPSDLNHKIGILKEAFLRLFKMEVPLIRVDSRFFKIEEFQDNDPPLALLFKRVGTGGTKLSDADYVYSIIKHLRHETYDLVESLYEPMEDGLRNVACLLTATDLVMSAVRLAAVSWNTKDWESPSKKDFHKMLQSGDFLNQKFMPLIERKNNSTAPIEQYFAQIQNCLEYRKDDQADIGIPRHMFPHLGRPLVQVLLYIAQINYLADSSSTERRNDILRFVLFWLVCVNDHRKASEISYKFIKNCDVALLNGNQLGQNIHDELISKKVASRLFLPLHIQQRVGLAHSPIGTTLLRGESRFTPMKDDDYDQNLCRFYRRWWQPWTHQHPMLLWLQRDLVTTIAGDPMSGREEDTPYDYDHILPSSHWSDWRGLHNNKDKLLDFAESQYWVVGNGIGNVRVWDSSKNRMDGDVAPAYKLGLAENPDSDLDQDNSIINVTLESCDLLSQSAIPDCEIHKNAWVTCSRDKANKHSWDMDRALAFQRAVEMRTFHLYSRYFEELRFDTWYMKNYSQEKVGVLP